jgi:hypothetical protein
MRTPDFRRFQPTSCLKTLHFPENDSACRTRNTQNKSLEGGDFEFVQNVRQ